MFMEPLKTPNSALRSFDKMLIYLNVNSAFVSVASLDYGVFRGSIYLSVLSFWPQPIQNASTPGVYDLPQLLQKDCAPPIGAGGAARLWPQPLQNKSTPGVYWALQFAQTAFEAPAETFHGFGSFEGGISVLKYARNMWISSS